MPKQQTTRHRSDAKAKTLHLYNALGAQLGLPPRAPDGTFQASSHTHTQKCELVSSDADAQQVITLVSGLDDATDRLMHLLAIPDMDSEKALSPTTFIRRMTGITAKEGREFSAENLASLQQLHDILCDMTDGAICPERQAQQQQASATLSRTLSDLATLTRKVAEHQRQMQKTVGVLQVYADTAHGVLDLGGALQRFEQRIAEIAEIPLPRPTHMRRRVIPLD